MRIDIYHYFADSSTVQLVQLLESILTKVNHMSAVTDKLKVDVAAQTTVIQSAVTLIQGFPAIVAEAVRKALEDAGVGQAATDAAVAEADAAMSANTDSLAAALTTNTSTPPAP